MSKDQETVAVVGEGDDAERTAKALAAAGIPVSRSEKAEGEVVVLAVGPEAVQAAVSSSIVSSALIILADLAPSAVKAVEKAAPNVPLVHAVPLFASRTLIVSGTSPAAVQAAQPVLAALGEPVTFSDEEGLLSQASEVKLVDELLRGVHVASAAEALALGKKAGLSGRTLYKVITGAAGNSWAFEHLVPKMLDGDFTPSHPLQSTLSSLNTVITQARSVTFNAPLTALSKQLLVAAVGAGLGSDDEAGLIRLWERFGSSDASEAPGTPEKSQAESSPLPKKVSFIGLGAMGLGMATALVKQGVNVVGYDIWEGSAQKFRAAGGQTVPSPAEAAKDADVLILMVVSAAQAEDVLFSKGVAAALPDGASVILSSTVPPSAALALDKRMDRGISLVDAPVSGGTKRAADGDLTIMASGSDAGVAKALAVLKGLTGAAGNAHNLHIIPGGVSKGSAVKLVNQHLAGVHIAAAAEGMAFGAKLGLDTRKLYGILSTSSGASWMFGNRVLNMLNDDRYPKSAVNIFVKDLGIVSDEAGELGIPVFIAAAAHQQFLFASAAGWGQTDDSGVVRLWNLARISVVREAPRSLKEVTASLPPPYADDAKAVVTKQLESGTLPVLVVLDDDPTGTQTVHDINVLARWDVDTLTSEFGKKAPGFFILTNSRALPNQEARKLIKEIVSNVKTAAAKSGVTFEIVLRGDSTLRGHFPEEPDVTESVIGGTSAWILTPFFQQGGRLTVDDIHYVANGDTLVPAGQTEFAKDASFGYRSSNLKDWVVEKSKGRFRREDVYSVSLTDLRTGGPEKVASIISEIPTRSVLVVNALVERDMDVFVAGLVLSQRQTGHKYLFRTAAAFVSSRLAIIPKPPLSAAELGLTRSENSHGGLIVVGSYVPKSTAQLNSLLSQRKGKLAVLELSIPELLESDESFNALVERSVRAADEAIRAGTDALVFSERKLVKGPDAESSLRINERVARALVLIARGIPTRPRFFIAKGGITSSDGATKSLGLRYAKVLGQAAPGIPLWSAEDPESLHPGIPYVVFPGNVGTVEGLGELVAAYSNTP